MAFAIRDLSVLAYANGFTLWHYKAGTEALADVSGDDYFADAADMMAGGDMIMVSATESCRMLCVALADGGTVRSAPLS
jgi:outer membrane protein assembly factor BamB